MKSLKTKTQSELTVITRKLERARVKANDANSDVFELEKQQRALQSALDILEGTEVSSGFPVSTITLPSGYDLLQHPKWNPSPNLDKYVDFNGEKILLEPGFEVRKNSLGEDSLVPIGLDIVPMTEPTIPQAPPSILPPIGADEGFVSDLPGGLE